VNGMTNGASALTPGNLPQSMTSFVGRRHEITGARQRMAQSRLVTLLGPGGVGKTRLALRVAEDARRAFRDGVWLADLAGLTDPERLTETLLSALAVPDQSARGAEDKLHAHLRERRLLLVVDNCEHLLPACAVHLDRLLRAAPGLHVLATSREPLGVDGEHLLTVPPLPVPPCGEDGSGSPETLAQYDSVRLLVDRARAVRADFTITEDNHRSVARLCAWLDGIPLAVELAATRLRSLTVGEVVDRLTDRFGFLTGGNRAARPRQRSLHAMINWSYELCTPSEQLLWARLSVFPGSMDLDAAEAVCAGDGLPAGDVLDVLDQLVAKSVLLAEYGAERVRYRMLVSVREFGAALLADSGERCPLRSRHCAHYVRRARAMAADWAGPGQAAALARMRADHPNLVAALEWSSTRPGQARTAAALAAALRYHWIVGGYLSEGRRWLDRILDDPGLAGTGPERAEALWVTAWACLVQGDWDAGRRRIGECAALAAELGDPAVGAHVAHWSGLAGLFTGDLARAVTLFEQALAGHRAAGDTAAVLTASFQFAVVLAYHGQPTRARYVCREAVELAERHGERWARAYLHWAGGIVSWREGAHAAAEERARAALGVQGEFRDGICIALSVELLTWASAAQGAASRSAELSGAADAVWAGIGTEMHAFGPALESDSLASTAAAERVLGPRRFAELAATGRTCELTSAIALALDDRAAPDPAPEDCPLTRRETEVARLVARGLSNRAVAETLVLSRRTVDGHVEHIFSKLGFTARAQVAAWVTEHLPENG
jgi:predicted ATPase/DNA-binding CsgD family transcriptional regulator